MCSSDLGYIPALYDSLGIFLSLITVNCIILGRAEVFASKNSVGKSALDGLGMGVGFTFALFLMGSAREILGSGTWMDMDLGISTPITFFALPAGGFLTLGFIIAIVNKLKHKAPPKELGCEGCPNASVCHGKEGNE